MAPTFMEQYGRRVAAGSVLGLAVVGAAVWFLMRPKRVEDVPIEVQTRAALEALRAKAEDGTVLSRISQLLRAYTTKAFGLPPGELTTTEFCQLIADHERLGSELAGSLAEFLRRCDERKFSPPGPGPAQGAVAQALELVARAEARRAPPASPTEAVPAQHAGISK